MTAAQPVKRRWIWYALGVLAVVSVISSALHPRDDGPAEATSAAGSVTTASTTAGAPVAETAPASAALSRAVLSYGQSPRTHKNISYSNDNGRQVYDSGITSLGQTVLVFHAPGEWWLEIKQPTFSVDDLVPAGQRGGENSNGVARDAIISSGPLKGMTVN